MEVGLSPGDFVLDGDPVPFPQKGAEPPSQFSAISIVAKRLHALNTTWYGARPLPRRLCVRWGPRSPSTKGAQPPIFGPYLLRPNGCMDQDVTWYGARPRPRRLCVRWGPRSPSPKGGAEPPKFSAHVYCVQTAGCITMPLDMEVGLSAGDFVFDGDPV